MDYKRILITLIAQIGEFWLQLLVNFCLHITSALRSFCGEPCHKKSSCTFTVQEDIPRFFRTVHFQWGSSMIRVFLCMHVKRLSVVGRMHNDLRERDFNSGFVKHDL